MDAEHYIAIRQQELKVLLRAKRKAAGYSQQLVAQALSCARTRIVDIEDIQSTAFYSVSEVELLAWLFGLNPLELLRGSGQNYIHLGQFVTDRRTKDSLLEIVDCALPQSIAEFYIATDYVPMPILFSPSGAVVATFVDITQSENWDNWEGGDPYQFTLLCWDAKTGCLLCARHMPYVERLVIIDDTRIAIATSQPSQRSSDDLDYEGENHLHIWNFRTDTIENQLTLLDRLGNLAVNQDGSVLAAYFPATTTIQCWKTSEWLSFLAVELETLKGDLGSIGRLYQATDDVRKLPRKRKFDSWISEHHATRFEFMNEHTLAIHFGKNMMNEFDLYSSPRGFVPFEIVHPTIPWAPLTHLRSKEREIAVKDMMHDYRVGESQIELWYLKVGKERPRPEISIQTFRRIPGALHVPTIIDEACVLALVEYNTPYPLHMGYKTRLGLCNVVSGMVVMLNDHERLQVEDDQGSAGISPRGDAVAYWVIPREGLPRLTIQYISDLSLRLKGYSLAQSPKA